MPGSGKAGFDTLVEIIHKPLGEMKIKAFGEQDNFSGLREFGEVT